MKKTLSVFLLLAMLLGALAFPVGAADDFSTVLASFPDAYKAALLELHQSHPNWKFESVNVGKNFATVLSNEHNCKTKLNLVEVSSASDARACQKSCANAAYHTLVDGVYRCASYDYIAECMDPTNYLRESLIFQFEDLGAKAYYTQEKLETALKATSSFMYNKTYRTSSKTYYYSSIILDACNENGVDALFIISRITNEVGSASPAKLATGYAYEYEKGKTKTVYNFFNIGGNVAASAKYAYNHAWTNPKAALEGGIKFIAQNYVKAGQYTNYFQKFQVNPNCSYGFYEHQYMQGVDAVINEASYTYNNYAKLGIVDKARTFKIPVYNNLEKVDYEAQDICFKNASFSTDFAYVNAQVSSSLAVRTKPSTTEGYANCRIVRGTLLKVTGKSGVWYKVSVLNGDNTGKSGYCHGDYVNLAQRLAVAKGYTLTLQPKLRTSTCSYAAAYHTVSGAVSVDKNGVASGKKIGTSVFKITSSAGNIGYLELECTGLPDAPVFALAGGNKKVNITWKAVKDAIFYRVYSYDSSTQKFTKLAQVSGTAYTVSDLKEGTNYTFLVRAFDINGIGSAYTKETLKSALTTPAKPAVKTSATTNTVTLSWSKVAGAANYRVWSYNAKTAQYTKLGDTTALKYKISALKANTQYTYLVRACNESGRSPYTLKDNVSITTAPPAPQAAAKGGKKQVTLTWNKVKGANTYKIYQFNSSSNSYAKVAQTTTNTFTAKNLADGTQYTFLVRAYNEAGAASSYTAENHVTAITLCAKPGASISADSNSVSLRWSKLKGAQKYGVWAYDTKVGKYTKLANTAGTVYRISGLKANTQYTYLVRAYNESGWGAYVKADNVSTITAPTAPKVSAKREQNGVVLSWNSCAGAKQYRIYRFDAETGTYTRLGATTALGFTHSDAPQSACSYLVRAVNALSNASTYTEQNLVVV